LNKTAVENSRGLLVIISAPSGGGKTTVVDRLLKRHPEWKRSISMTTRAPRTGEKDGGDYFFVSQADFERMEKAEDFLESARVFDQSYGTPKSYVMDCLNAGEKVILAIDIQGMKKIKKLYASQIPMVTIFLLPPSIKVLRERLEGRKTEAAEEIERRIAIAQEEIKAAKLYDFTVMNQSLEQTVLEIEAFIEKTEKDRRENANALRPA